MALSVSIVDRGFLTPYSIKTPYIAHPHFQILFNLPSSHAHLLNENMDLNLSSVGTLVPAAPSCIFFMQQGIKFTECLTRMTSFLPVL